MTTFVTDFIEWLAKDTEFSKFYAEELRGNLFNGFLTFGGFILAAYTFIVIHMKNEVFDSEEYVRNFSEKKKADGRLKIYAPLIRMSSRLFLSVVLTIVAGILQLTIGLIPQSWAALVCTVVAVIAILAVADALRLMSHNLKVWMKYLDSHSPGNE